MNGGSKDSQGCVASLLAGPVKIHSQTKVLNHLLLPFSSISKRHFMFLESRGRANGLTTFSMALVGGILLGLAYLQYSKT